MLKKIFKSIGYILLFVLLLLIGAYFAIQQESVQNWLTKKVTTQLSNKLGAEVKVGHIKIDFLNHLNVNDVFVADQNKDTILFAGELQFYITDWFILKKEQPVISYIGLSNAIVNLRRSATDSIWNYAFIANALQSKNTSTPVEKNTNNAIDTSMAFALKSIKLNNVKFNSIDAWAGENLIAAINKIEIDTRTIDWKQKSIDVSGISVNKTNFTYADYIGGKPPRIKKDTIDTTPFNPNHWKITFDAIDIDDCKFNFKKNNATSIVNVFNENDIDLQNINASFEHVTLRDDTLQSKIKSLEVKDRCGFAIQQLKANLRITPKESKLDKLFLKTNHSTISDYFALQYNRFPDFNSFIDKVTMVANFNNSNISFADIAYFAPTVSDLTVKNAIINSGKATGTVDHLIAKDVNISVGNSSLIGDLTMKGLPDINTTFIELLSKNLQTSGSEIIKFIPQANTNNVSWASLNSINFKGKYSGYINDFNTDGLLSTNLGSVSTKIHMTFLKNQQPTYEGYFSTNQLQLGKIIKQDVIGNLSASGNIKGQGFDLDNLNTSFAGDINSIETKKYTYQHVFIDGVMNKRKFDGKINSKDPNITMNFDGQFDFSTSDPNFKLKTKLVNFNLQSLGLSKQPIIGSALMDLNFKGSNIDNFTGTAKLYQVHVANDDKQLNLDSAIITSTPIGINKQITLRSSAADVDLKGQFTIANLPDALQLYLSNYLPNYIPKPRNTSNQKFSFDVRTKNIEPILATFLPKIKGGNNANIVGALDMFARQLTLNIDAEQFIYDNYTINQIKAKGVGNFDSLQITGRTGSVIMSEQEIIPSATFITSIGNDTAMVNIGTSGGAYNVKNASIMARGFAENSKLYLSILPSSFYFNNSKWDLQTNDYVLFQNYKETINGEIVNKTNINLKNLILTSGLQRIELQSTGTQNENILAHIQNIDIEELAKFADRPLDLSGRINGDIMINEYATKPAYSGDIKTTQIKFKSDTLGELFAKLDYDNATKMITIDKRSGLLFDNNKSIVYGSIDLNGKEPMLDLHAKLEQTKLKTLENFFEGFIANTSGTADGVFDVKGSATNYQLDGTVTLNNLSTEVIYLGTSYTIPKGKVTINETDINLGEMTMIDQLGNKAKLSGHLYHDHFNHLRFGKEFGEQLPLTVKSDQFQFLNTNALQNNLYYGNVIAKGAMYLSGPLEDLYMEIIATTKQGSNLTIPIRGSFDANQYEYFKFKSYDENKIVTTRAIEKNKLLIKLSINATPDAEVNILMDPTTGEEIVGRGSGTINMDIDLNNEIKMNGDYVISKGNYGFIFRNLLRKDLYITPGGKISWDGKPLEAKLDLEATYATTANLVPLLGNNAANATNDEKIPYPTFAIIKLSGPMLTPNINYDIVQPANSDVNSKGYQLLKQLKSNDQKLISQIGGIILTGQFINTEANSGSPITTSAALINTINGVVSSTFSNIISQKISDLINAKNLRFDVGVTNVSDSINQFNYKISKSYMNDKIIFEIGDNINYNSRSATTAKFTGIPSDFRFKYLINSDGNLALNLFRTTYTDISSVTQNQDRKIGLALSYRKSFNTLNELFRKSAVPNTFIPIPQDSIKTGTW
jgi:hypothetical protein